MLERAVLIGLGVLTIVGAGLAQTTVNPDSLGAVGDGTTWDHDAIQLAIDTAGVGGTIVLTHGKTYSICKQILLFEGQTLVGNGATLKRCDKVATTLAAPAAAGASQISVADAGDLEVGFAIVVYTGPTNDDGEAANIHRIEAINGSNVSFTGVLEQSYPAGATVAILDDMIKASGFGIRIEGLQIDGNRRNNEGWIAWQRGSGIVPTGGDIEITGNLFRDCWSNCIKPFSTDRLHITENVFDSVAAAVIHLSSTDSLLFESNRMLHTNYSFNPGHSEATITFSALNRNHTVRNNCIYDSKGGAFGSINLVHNRDITIEDNEVCETEKFLQARLQAEPKPGYEDHGRLIFRNNTGVNVKLSRVTNAAEAPLVDDLIFEDNTIVNGYLDFTGLERGSIRGNDIVMLDWSAFGDVGGDFDSRAGLISLWKPAHTVVADNTLVGGEKGIYIRNLHFATSDSLVVEDNDLVDFTRVGIATARINRMTGITYESDNSGVRLESNTVVSDMLESAGDAGIRTSQGAQAVGNCSQTNFVGAEVNGTLADSATGTPSTLYLNNTLAGATAAVSFKSASYVSDVQFDTNTVSAAFPPEFAAATGSLQQGNTIDAGATCPEPSTPPIPGCQICSSAMPTLDGVFVDVRVLLEGAYAGAGQMATSAAFETSLEDSASAQPYGAATFSETETAYHGVEFASPSLPEGTIDWVVIALRTSPSAADEVARVAGLLMADGSVRSLDGTLQVFVPGVPKTSYYIVVYHRNHLAVMSNSPVALGTGPGLWDFRTGQSQAYSDSGPGLKDLGSGWFGMFGGDVNADGMIIASDFNAFLSATKSGLTGYRMEDFDMDDQVTAADFNMWLANTKAGAASQVP